MDYQTAILTLFPYSVQAWQKFLFQILLGCVVANFVLNFTDWTNPTFGTLKQLSFSVLPWVYIAWIMTGPLHAHRLSVLTLFLAFVAYLVSHSANTSSSPEWVKNVVTSVDSLSLPLLQGAIFASVYTYKSMA